MVDKQGRSLIAEARARTQINGDPAILAHFPALDTKVPAEVIQQGRVVLHAVGDVIVEQHAVLADSARMEETIERCYAFHMSQGQAERAGDILEQIRNALATISGIELMHRIRKGQFDLTKIGLKDTALPAVWNAVLSP
ncbi:hypothetical protein JOE11_005537 [Robbsia andropogonis]